MSLATPAVSQGLLTKKLSLDVKNTEARKVLQLIEAQTEAKFAYRPKLLSGSQKMSLHLVDRSLGEVLDILTRNLKLQYNVLGDQIILSPAPVPQSQPSAILRFPTVPESAGERLVKGKVTDEKGEALPGVNILLKGTQNGTISDQDGLYSISVPDNSGLLVFSFVGYKSQEVGVGPLQSSLDIVLKADAKSLEEVVVVGYGTVRREELTSAVVSVSSDEFITGAFNNPIQMIDGKVAGLTMGTAAAADPNSGSSLQLRGVASVNAGTGPLVVVDGVPGRDLASIPQDEIENITILKDGASAAIYGARGANGVILVTTKKGKEGESSVSYETYLTSNYVAKKPEVLSAREYVERGRSNLYDPSQADHLPYSNNFYDLLLRDQSFGNYHHLAIESGSRSSNYRLSMNYRDMNGIDIISKRKEYGARLNYNYTIRNKVSVYGNVYASKNKQDVTDYMAFRQAIKAQPTEPLYNPEDPSKYYIFSGHDYYNPVALLRTSTNRKEFLNLSGDLNIRWDLTDYLSTNLMVAENMVEGSGYGYKNSNSHVSRDNLYTGMASRDQSRSDSRILEWTGNYNLAREAHNLQLLAGYSYQKFLSEGFSAWNANFPSDALLWNNLGGGTWHSLSKGLVGPSSYKSTNTLIAFFGRANYSYQGRYLLTASLRREGSSKFGINNKWGNFPAISGAWIMSREKFFNVPAVNSLKLRASYGVTGRENINPLLSLSTYSANSFYNMEGGWLRTWGPSGNPNPNLKWEVGYNTNFGADVTLFNQRLTVSLDYFIRKTKDLLFYTPVPMPPNLYGNTWSNVGSINNKGIELVLDAQLVNKSDFGWTTNLVGSYGKSRMMKIAGSASASKFMDLYTLPSPGNPGPIVRLEEGQEIGSFYMYKHAGVDDNGNLMVYNKENEAIIASAKKEADKRYVGNGIPDYIFSWTNNFRYKRFDLSLFFKGALKYDVYNLHEMYYGLINAPGNVLTVAYGKNAHIKSEKEASSYFLEKGDYLNLRNVSLGYRFSLGKQTFLRQLRANLNATNLFTLTKFSGLDITQLEVNGLTPGIQTMDFYPTTRSVTLSVQLTF
ncbi:TonB-dependent receptor [Ravibacter arvi]|uniref:TonB-dependent receptor n=1 Tax=Ravibacter arvi TaxID=2051041 RepID=A0ABP8MCE4_9BACT